MAFDEALAALIRDALARRRNIEEKRVFGGVGFRRNGNLLVGVWKRSLVVRLGEEEGKEALKLSWRRSGMCRSCYRGPSMSSEFRCAEFQHGDG